MGQQHSTNEPPLYKQVNNRNVEGIKALYRGGADIERIDSEGRTPLIFACQNPDFYMVAKTLIELGANVNAYRSGRHSGTPLHHAAKKGLDCTVKLLLSHGANAFIVNDYSQTPLDVARALGYSNIVRTLENHISLFSSWMRDFSGSGSAEPMVSKKVWVVVTPCGSLSRTGPVELELATYSSLQDATPRLILSLGKAYMEEPNFHQSDPKVVLTYVSTNEQLKFGPAKVGDRQQLEWFCNSCKGIPPAMHPTSSNIIQAPIVSASAPPVPPDFGLSVQTNNAHDQPISSIYDDGSIFRWTFDEAGPSTFATSTFVNEDNDNLVALPPLTPLSRLPNDSVSTDLYPPIYSNSNDLQAALSESMASLADDITKQKEKESSCAICENAQVEGACVPCGHMAGCMKCLNKIKMMKLGCPICRTNIDQVVRLFAV